MLNSAKRQMGVGIGLVKGGEVREAIEGMARRDERNGGGKRRSARVCGEGRGRGV